MNHPLGKIYKTPINTLHHGIPIPEKIHIRPHTVPNTISPDCMKDIDFQPYKEVDNIFNLKNTLGTNGPQGHSVNVTDGYYSILAPESYIFSFTPDAFSKCVTKVMKKIKSNTWSLLSWCPFINIIDLLILKIDELEKKIEELEKPKLTHSISRELLKPFL